MSTPPLVRQLRGASRLAIDATTGLTDLVEAMHGAIARLPMQSVPERTGGITGLVYRSVRGVTSLVGSGLDLGLRQLEPLVTGPGPHVPSSSAVLAALNGVFGDYLAATDNPLSTPMHLPEWPTDARQPLVLLHGLCMNGAQWQRDGADFAAALARLGHAPVALTYNSGLTIAENGWQLAELLEARLAGSAERDLSLVGHSMGGLVARSAIHQAQAAGMAWPRRLRRLVTLGTPHHGAPLERGGQQLQQLLALTPYARPLAHLAQRRSAGIRDLRYGCLLAADSGKASRIPLPEGVECYAVAACTAERLDGLPGKMLGDGLVPVPSALGQHRQVAWRLAFDDTATIVKLGHLALQTDPRVLAQLQAWLGD